MNTGAPWPGLDEAEARVLEIQAKLHQWAKVAPNRRFDDLYNLVYDPAILVVAWSRVRTNRGARSAGVDKVEPRSITSPLERFLPMLRDELKARQFVPLPVRERYIPKGNGKTRRLGIATARDRTVQAALKLILEPIFEADFRSFSYGFRPNRRAQDAVAEIYNLTTNSYEWVLEADITACFDEISHSALMGRLRRRVGDKRVLALVKAFLKAGILGEDGVTRNSSTGTPQGGILSPLLANVALSVLDDHFAEAWASFGRYGSFRQKRRARGLPTYRLVRYADDFVVLVAGTRGDAEQLRAEVAAVLSPMGLRLSEEKTGIRHIDEGFDFLGWRIQRQKRRGTKDKRCIYTWPARKALASIKARVRTVTRQGTNHPLAHLLRQLNLMLRGGPTTSGTAHRRRPSVTCTSSPGGGLSAGSDRSIAGPIGESSAGATSQGGGRRTAEWRCSIRRVWRSLATASGVQPFPRRGSRYRLGPPDDRRHGHVESRMR